MKDITGYEGLYAITSCGKVWSYRSKKFLKPNIYKTGYYAYRLYKDGKQKSYLAHRLVAEAYIDNPDKLPEVNHKDEIKSHNWIGNLEWCSNEYNRHYGTQIQRASEKKQTKVMCNETGQVFDSFQDAHEWMGFSRRSSALSCYFKRGYKTCGGYTWRKL